MTPTSNLLKISLAVNVSEIWMNRVRTAFELVGLPESRSLYVKATAEVADKLKFHKITNEFHDQTTGEVTITEEDNTLGAIDDSDVTDDDIVEAISSLIDEVIVEQDAQERIEALELQVATLEGEKFNLEKSLEVYVASEGVYAPQPKTI